ncbi:MAG: hypothetical protein ACP5NE_01430 [Candidatus Micrarchaeia archaeon]
MSEIEVDFEFKPATLKAYAKNEAEMGIKISNKGEELLWCEAEVGVVSPLSLAHDRELELARTRIGIIKQGGSAEKRVKLYTRPNNFPDDYKIKVTIFAYGEDGAISQRIDKESIIACVEQQEKNDQMQA